MSKLLKLREFFTIDDAAKHLSDALSEPVSLSDFYRLILDGHLTLSIRFHKSAYAALGKLTEAQDAGGEEVKLTFDLITQSPLLEPKTLQLGDYAEYTGSTNIAITKGVYSIVGIWDLEMVGAGVSEVERLYESSIGLSSEYDDKKPIYVSQGNILGQLKLRINPSKEDVELVFNYKHALDSNCKAILNERGVSVDSFFDFVLKDTNKAMCEFVTYVEGKSHKDAEPLTNFEITKLYEWSFGNPMPMPPITFQTSSKLEDHQHQLVIRTKEISRFISALEDESGQEHLIDKPLLTRERDSYLKLLAAFLSAQNINPSTSGVTTAIIQMVDEVGLSISENTVRKILNEVKEIN